MKLFLIAMISFPIMAGVIKSPSGCDVPLVVKELKDIVVRENGLTVKNLRIHSKGPAVDAAGSYLCECSLSMDGKTYDRYVYYVMPINKALPGLDKRTAETYKAMPENERKKYVRVEYVKKLNIAH